MNTAHSITRENDLDVLTFFWCAFCLFGACLGGFYLLMADLTDQGVSALLTYSMLHLL